MISMSISLSSHSVNDAVVSDLLGTQAEEKAERQEEEEAEVSGVRSLALKQQTARSRSHVFGGYLARMLYRRQSE